MAAPTKRSDLDRYATLFDARDWDGVRALVSDDCRLDVVSKSQRRGKRVGMYFRRYEGGHRGRLGLRTTSSPSPEIQIARRSCASLLPILGTTARVSEVLGGTRALTLDRIRKLHALFDIPLESLGGGVGIQSARTERSVVGLPRRALDVPRSDVALPHRDLARLPSVVDRADNVIGFPEKVVALVTDAVDLPYSPAALEHAPLAPARLVFGLPRSVLALEGKVRELVTEAPEPADKALELVTRVLGLEDEVRERVPDVLELEDEAFELATGARDLADNARELVTRVHKPEDEVFVPVTVVLCLTDKVSERVNFVLERKHKFPELDTARVAAARLRGRVVTPAVTFREAP